MDFSYIMMIGFGWAVLSVPAALLLGSFMGASSHAGEFETVAASVSIRIDQAA